MFYPNQKEVVINREMVNKSSTRLFLCAYQDNISNAMKILTHTAFKVYICLLFNKDKFSVEFSPAYLSQVSGLCLDTIRKAFAEMEKKNFIVAANETRTLFNFYETPQMKMMNERREIIDEYTGQIYNYTFEELKQAIGIFEASRIWQNNGGSVL